MLEDTEDRPLITLAILSYNQEGFIAEAIEGGLVQTYSPLEIIISDDCSTDRTFEVVQNTLSGEQTPHRIRTNRNDRNLGLCAHINKVFEMASGRLIVMNGGDDVSFPLRVQEIYEAWLSHGKPDAIQSEWIDIDENGRVLDLNRQSVRAPQDNVLKWTNPRFLDQIESHFFFHYVGAALTYDRKAVYEDFSGLDEELFNEDQVLPFRASLKRGVLYLPKALLKRRQHSNNLTNLHRRRYASPNTTLFDRQLVMRDLRIRRLMRYQAHVRDLERCLKTGEIDVSAEALKKAISDKAAIVQLLIDWWDMSFVLKLRAFAAIARKGTPEERRWAAKRILPWRIYEFLATKPWRRTNLPHPR